MDIAVKLVPHLIRLHDYGTTHLGGWGGQGGWVGRWGAVTVGLGCSIQIQIQIHHMFITDLQVWVEMRWGAS